MGLKGFYASLMFIAIFSFALINYSTDFGIDNGSEININSEDSVNDLKTQVSGNTYEFSTTTTNGTLNSFQESSITAGDENTERGSWFKSISSATGTIGNAKALIRTLWISIFGGENDDFSVILSIILSMISVIGLLYAWKAWKGGNVD